MVLIQVIVISSEGELQALQTSASGRLLVLEAALTWCRLFASPHPSLVVTQSEASLFYQQGNIMRGRMLTMLVMPS